MSTNYLAATLTRVSKEVTAALKRKPQHINEYNHVSLTTYDDEQKVSAYQTQLECMRPDKQHLYELLQEFRETKKQWEQRIKSIKPQIYREAEEAEFTHCLETNDFDVLIPAAQTMFSEFGHAVAEVEGYIRKGDKNIRRAAGAPQALVAPAAGAPVTYKFKLPDIEIKPFKGEITEFNTFWGAFETLIDRAVGLTDQMKFEYLLQKLEGQPYEDLKNYPAVDASYDPAKQLLKDRYGKKDVILFKIRTKIMALKKCYNKYDVKNMFYLADALIRQIEVLDNTNANSPDLLTHLQRLLPPFYQERVIT